MSRFHLHGLDSLRAIAALVVVAGHVELFKLNNNISNDFWNVPMGQTGVILFFVISGFLISLLLLREKEEKKSVRIKKFYLRRILRIWPLYFLVIGLSMIIFNYHPVQSTLILSLLLLPNIPDALGSVWMTSPQLWSIGVEEQFYLIWPVFMKYIKSKFILILIVFIIIYTFLPFALSEIFQYSNLAHTKAPGAIAKFFETAKFNCMAMGALLACLVQKNYSGLNFLRKKPLAYFLMLLPFLLWAFNIRFGKFTDEVMGVLFTLLIANVIHKNYWIFNNRLLNYLGKISYGIYMYHWIIILLLIKLYLPYFPSSNFIRINILLYASEFIITIMIASLSYYTVEKYFLHLKKKFEIV